MYSESKSEQKEGEAIFERDCRLCSAFFINYYDRKFNLDSTLTIQLAKNNALAIPVVTTGWSIDYFINVTSHLSVICVAIGG